MQRERMFELLKAAGFERIDQCCPHVKTKFCSNDAWRGDMGALFSVIGKDYYPDLTVEEKMLQETYPEQPVIGQLHEGIYGKYLFAFNKEQKPAWFMVTEIRTSEWHVDYENNCERQDALKLYRRIHDFVNNEAPDLGAFENHNSMASVAMRYGSSLHGLSMKAVAAGFGHHIRFDENLCIHITLFKGVDPEEVTFFAAEPTDNYAIITATTDFIARESANALAEPSERSDQA